MEKEQIKQIRSIIEELQMSPKGYRIYISHKESTADYSERVKATTPHHIITIWDYDLGSYKWGEIDKYNLFISEIHNPDNEDYYEKLFLSIDLDTMKQTKLDIKINE